ncbi:MAG: hypothetical protein ACXABK_03015 [Candidatus Heimdallarchaeaceae archaeon]|jgi:hypothetical protein
MRIRDRVFEEDWKKKILVAPGSSIMILAHHLFGALAIGIIVLQSAISLNVYIFSIWLILGIIIVLTDIFRGKEISLRTELSFGFFLVLGTIISLLIANPFSMFFPESLGVVEIIYYQSSAGLCVALRFFLAFFYIEYFSQEYDYLETSAEYSTNQLELYKLNLTKTDFEHEEIKQIGIFEKWWLVLKSFLWPFIIISILAIFSVLYALLIYYVFPSNTIPEFIIRPSLIVIAILYTILLIQMNSVLTKIHQKEKEEKNQTDIEESEESEEQI